MTTYTRTLPCTVTFTHNPAEKATLSEPPSPEEFIVDSIVLAGLELITPVSSFFDTDLEDALYNYLKEDDE